VAGGKRGIFSLLGVGVAVKEGGLAGNRGVKGSRRGRFAVKTRGSAPKRPPVSHWGQPPTTEGQPPPRRGQPPPRRGQPPIDKAAAPPDKSLIGTAKPCPATYSSL
jgi:hypothetical protein